MAAKKINRPSKEVLAKVRSLKGHRGQVAVIEPKSGDYFIDKNLTLAMRKAKHTFPDKVFYCLRIGSDFLYKHPGIVHMRKHKGAEGSL